MRDGLGVGRDAVMLQRRQVHELGAETAQDGLDLVERLIWGAVLNEDQRLVEGIDVGAMQRVARDDGDIGREVGLEGFDFGRFA